MPHVDPRPWAVDAPPVDAGERAPIFHPHLPPVIRGREVVDVALPEPSEAPRCRLCGRVLRSEASRVAGVGPVCLKRSGARSRVLSLARASPGAPTALIPGQTELPLQPLQVTLWSL